MEEVDPSWTVSIVVCANQRGPNATRRCCGRENGKRLRAWLRDKAREEGLRKSIVVHAGGCMDVCAEGVTVAAHTSDGRRVWIVDPGEEEALWTELRSLIE